MFKEELIIGTIQSSTEANKARLRAPICEQFAREIEEETFYDNRIGATFSYDSFATAVKKYGYGGVTHLNERQISACFMKVDQPAKLQTMSQARAIYFNNVQKSCDKEGDLLMDNADSKNEGISVDFLLHIAVLLCTHASQEEQLDEMWLLVNPQLEDEIEADTVHQFIRTLSEIAINKTKQRIEDL